jgi:Ni/Co efflux regulator RcnB
MRKLTLLLTAAAMAMVVVPFTAAKAAPATQRTLATNDMTDVSSRRGHGWGHHHGHGHHHHHHGFHHHHHHGGHFGHHYGWYKPRPYFHHYGWYRGHRRW